MEPLTTTTACCRVVDVGTAFPSLVDEENRVPATVALPSDIVALCVYIDLLSIPLKLTNYGSTVERPAHFLPFPVYFEIATMAADSTPHPLNTHEKWERVAAYTRRKHWGDLPHLPCYR